MYSNNCYLSKDNVLFNLNDFNLYELDSNISTEVKKIMSGYKNSNSELTKYFNKQQERVVDETLKILKINVNNKCNLKCKYCYASEGTYNGESKEISDNTILEVEKLIKKFKTIDTITFFGGEPMLSIKKIKNICERTRKINEDISFFMQTNGTTLSQEGIKIIKKYNIQVTLSVDGPKEINDKNRVFKNNKGTYDKIYKNFKKIENHINFIQATYCKETKMTKEEIYSVNVNQELTHVAVNF
ncbi:radical SAM protein [Fusobacteria bacterium ZRK30]|nr:radical SAM protein [Fusobacteria bacterium ZRK30]